MMDFADKYAEFVIASYVIAAVLLLGLCGFVILRLRSRNKLLQELEAQDLQRRQMAEPGS